MGKKTGNSKTTKVNNQNVLAQYLFEEGATSIPKLSEKFGLSLPSIYKNIEQLMDKGIVLKNGEGDSLGGRRPMLFSFNYDFGYIVSMDLKGEYLKLALANLALNIIDRQEIYMRDYKEGEDLIIKSMEVIHFLLSKHGIDSKKLLSIAIGFPDSINQNTGKISVLPRWFDIKEDINIESIVRKAFPTRHVIIKNDINLAAIGEKRYGIGKHQDNLIYVSVDMGVGSGIIINGNIYEGSRFASGEIAYSKISMDSSRTLEDDISIKGIIDRLREDIRSGEGENLKKFLHDNLNTLNIEAVTQAIKKKDPYIISIMEDITAKLGFILSNICVLLDIELIVISAKIADMGYDIKYDLFNIINRNIPMGVNIEYGTLNHDEILYGGFALSLDKILKNIANY